jgi:hypothetical protein
MRWGTNNCMERPPSEANNWIACQEIPRFCGTRKFITIFTRAHHLDLILSQFNPIHTLFQDAL